MSSAVRRAAVAPEGAGADTRERILAAALQTFSQQGFDGATTRDIAARAGVNLGLIQYYFGGKQKLWRAAVDRAFARLAEELGDEAQAVAAFDDGARARRLIRRFVRFVGRHPEFVRLMHDEGKRRGPRMRWLVDRHIKPLYEGMRVLLVGAQERGFLPKDVDPLHLHYILVGAVALIFHQAEECRRLTGVDPTDEAVIEVHAGIVERLFFGPPNEENA